MNFENYNNIYKEILDDETGDLSANYLLNKYEIKHDEELLNILNQIKKNEYISSDNKIINRLITELDENDTLLDINEIINIKDKVLNINDFDLDNDEVSEKPNIETAKIIKDKSERSKGIINQTTNNKNYFLYSFPIILLILTLFLFNYPRENKVEKLPVVKNEEIINNNNEIKKEIFNEKKVENQVKVEEKNLPIDNDTKNTIESSVNTTTTKKEIEKSNETVELVNKDIKKDLTDIVESSSTSEIKLNKIEDLEHQVLVKSKNNIKLKSLDEIVKYIKELKVEEGKLLFEGNYYSVNSNLFGFRIFKITPLYVKFEDVNKNIRKRFLIKK